MSFRIIAVVGPTAAGKTDVAQKLAVEQGGEIVNVDARQIYAHMRIGVAQPGFVGDVHDIEGIPYHLFEIIEPSETMDVARFVKRAHEKINEIHERGNVPILVGGTGFYIDSVCRGAVFGEKKVDLELRAKLESQPLDFLVAQLTDAAPDIAARTDIANKRRVVRALERFLGGEPDVTYTNPYDVVYIGVQPERELLKARIVQRVESMIVRGLEAEVRHVVERFGIGSPGMSAIGYKEWIPYFEGRVTREMVVAAIIANTWQYARRQMTWFRKNPLISWI